MNLFGINAMYSRISSYSKGMKQKLLIICSLIHNPDILIFDEPFSLKFVTADSGKLIGSGIITLVVISVLTLIHILIRNNMIFVGIYGLVLLIVNVILWKTSFKVSWKEIEIYQS